MRGREGGLSILNHIEDNLDSFITSSHFEMEYKKHRQRAIIEAMLRSKRRTWRRFSSRLSWLSQNSQVRSRAIARKCSGSPQN